MVHIKIKAISVNESYRGRRFKTPKLEQFKSDLFKQLPRGIVGEWTKIKAVYKFGVSSKASDGDNLIKALQDGLAEAYGFNDNQIYEWQIYKEIVKKGDEFIEFELSPL